MRIVVIRSGACSAHSIKKWFSKAPIVVIRIERVNSIMPIPTLDVFTRAYLEAALWTSDPDPGSGEWSESDWWCIGAIDPDSLTQAIEDCRDFQDANAELLDQAGTPEQNGHDFWLTRNRHGAGFWDRGYPDAIGTGLTNAAHAYGDCNVFGPETTDNGSVTDDAFDAWDGVIYFE